MPASKHFDHSDCINYAVGEQLLVLDANLRVEIASKSFYSTFKVTPAETVGRKLADLGNGQWNIPALLTQLHALPRVDGEFHDFEIEHDFPVLGRRTKQLGARRLSDGDTLGGMILLSIRDISGQKLIEAEAGRLLNQFRTTLASIGDAVIVTDPESRVTFMNPTAEKLTGWSQNDALQKQLTGIFNVVHEQSSQKLENLVAKAIHEGVAVGQEDHTVLIARDGTEWPIDNCAAPIFDAAGQVVGVVLVFHDTGNRRTAEHELQTSEVRYRRLFESAHDGIIILDATTAKVLDANPFMADLLGYPREHFLGKELWEIGVLKDAEIAKSAMSTLQKVGRIRYEDLPLEHKDGRHIPVEFVSNVYREGRRNVIQCNIRDITERKRLTEDLARARRDADAANRSKSEFLANMSHEIRTPMSGILGFAEMLLVKSPEECAQIGCVQIIRRNASHLLELINEILDLSKIEAGQMTVERVSCNLPELLAEVISLMRHRAVVKGLAFGVKFEGPIPRLIRSDPMRLRQILVNLLGNAIKFTESGRIDVRVADEGVGGSDIVLRIDVIDSGIGLLPEQLARLFRPFTQGDESITRKFGGTGLGLTISRQLAKLLGGDVTVKSQPRIGSTFTMKIDGGASAGVQFLRDLTEATLPKTGDHRTRANIRLRGRVLLVEDGVDNQVLLRMQLSDAGATVIPAMNGEVAVDFATTQNFDLILMDMQMPVMDGYAATRELRRRGLTTPIIALTAYAMSEDREKCLAAGCTGYLSKPIDEELLLKTAHQYVGSGHAPTPGEVAGPNVAGSPPPAADAGGFTSVIASIGISPNSVVSPNSIQSAHAGNARIMEIIPAFVAGLPVRVGDMLALLERNDLPAVQKIAHQLLGTCGGYGFALVSEPARTVEQSIKAGHDRESISTDVRSLIDVIRRIDGYDGSKETVAVGELVR
jgi:PAS domain S-box-containing protein